MGLVGIIRKTQVFRWGKQVCNFRPSGMSLALRLRDSLTPQCYVSPLGEAHSARKIVEERAVVRIGDRGRIVSIQRTRASIATIACIGESSEAAQTGAKEIYLQS